VNLRIQNLTILVRSIKTYYQVRQFCHSGSSGLCLQHGHSVLSWRKPRGNGVHTQAAACWPLVHVSVSCCIEDRFGSHARRVWVCNPGPTCQQDSLDGAYHLRSWLSVSCTGATWVEG
jgi:hypothetical protein